MIIAVNARFLLKDYLEGYGNFIFETCGRLAKKHPEHQFLYIFDRAFDPTIITAGNITPVIIGPEARHPILWQYWYNYKLPALVRKYKADVLLSPDGFCSLRTRIPQCLVIHDLAFLHHPAFIKKSHLRYYKKNTPLFASKAASIATVSEFSKNDLIQQYAIPASKINVVYNGIASAFQPFNWADKESIKSNYTAGKEYFLYIGAIHPRKNLMNLLKAFSLFKKRQKSNMQLLIAGRLAWDYEQFSESLKTYKYRQDVQLLGYLPQDQLASITAAAYALVYPSFFEGFGVPIVEAMQSGVPVITSNTSSMPEIAGSAALLADPHSISDLAEQMMRIFKDESLRNELIQKGFEQSNKFSWDKTADLLWESILQAVETKK